jgi:hypothetical protein
MSPPKITPRPNANNKDRGARRAPTRDELSSTKVKVLNPGAWNKADLLTADLGDGPMVIKDFSNKNWLIKLLGRLQISRECRAYRRLGAMAGVPGFMGRIDPYAISIEKIDCRPLGRVEDRVENGAARLGQLRGIMDRIHSAGVVHLDMRARDNVVIDREGRLFVIDFASALWFRPGGLAHRMIFGWLRRIDESAYLKWKRLLEAGPYTDEEEAFVSRHEILKALWPFNRKKRHRGRGAGNES